MGADCKMNLERNGRDYACPPTIFNSTECGEVGAFCLRKQCCCAGGKWQS